MKKSQLMLFVDFALACLLSFCVYLMGSIDLIRDMDTWFYFVFTPIIFLFLYKKRTKEERNGDNSK